MISKLKIEQVGKALADIHLENLRTDLNDINKKTELEIDAINSARIF